MRSLKMEYGLRFCRVVRSLTDVTGMQDVISLMVAPRDFIHRLKMISIGLLSEDCIMCHLTVTVKGRLRACLHGGGGPQVGEVTRFGG